ncbi:MAG: outer membrane lipid asymmetry maintenance protein MlaD [Pseudomonadota bacterium]
MAGSAAETRIGAVVLAAAGGFLVYAANSVDVGVARGSYEVVAEFRKAEGLSPGGDVRIAGVKVGTVSRMSLDPTTYKAVVGLSIDAGVKIPEDTAAKITASGLLGDNFVALDPGASEYMLEAGDAIQFTQGSVNLLDLAGRMVQGGGESALSGDAE